MKKNTILILAGLLLPALCFGAVSYERTPSGYTISNPVSFNISWDNLEDFLIDCPDEWGNNYWGFDAYGNLGNPDYYSVGIASSSLSYNFIVDLPIGEYVDVSGVCSPIENLSEGESNNFFLEWGGAYVIFEVVESEEGPTGGIWTLPADFLASTTAYIEDIFGDIWVLVAFMIGFPLAFWVILKIENLIEKKDKTKLKKSKDLKEKNNWL